MVDPVHHRNRSFVRFDVSNRTDCSEQSGDGRTDQAHDACAVSAHGLDGIADRQVALDLGRGIRETPRPLGGSVPAPFLLNELLDAAHEGFHLGLRTLGWQVFAAKLQLGRGIVQGQAKVRI
jgi:hypothetical protein